MHPRTKKQLEGFGLWEYAKSSSNLLVTRPLGYLELLRLNTLANVMFTDSGGLQEECCVLGTACLTMRWNTERPITLKSNGGSCVLVGNDVKLIRREFNSVEPLKKSMAPPLWDGLTSKRILSTLLARQASD